MAPDSGYLDNLYCKYTILLLRISNANVLSNVPVSHYAEGSFMPIIVQGYIFDLVPKKSPFYIRPVLNATFGQLTKRLVQPQLEKHLSMVSPSLHQRARSLKFENEFCTSDWSTSRKVQVNVVRRRVRTNRKHGDYTSRRDGKIDLPQAADYQMAFPLEALVAVVPESAGPKIKEYVKAVHERWALYYLGLWLSVWSSWMTDDREAYKTVRFKLIWSKISQITDENPQALTKGGEYAYAKLWKAFVKYWTDSSLIIVLLYRVQG